MVKQFDRVLQLHRLLQGRRVGLSQDELLEMLAHENLDCTKSTLKRSLRFLRDGLHAPLIHDAERGGYRYDGDAVYELPGLWFTAQELAALLVLDELLEAQPPGLLAEALQPLRAKLDRLLQRSVRADPDWRSRLRLLRMAARDPGPNFATVATALARHKQLRIDYHARSDDRMARRTVSPQRLTLYRDNWYLDAWCHRRDGLRTFALDRIIAAEMLPATAQRLPDDMLDAVLATSYGIFAGTPTATAILRFSAHAARWVSGEQWHPQQIDNREDDGSLTRRVPYHRAEELVMDILRHGPEVEVLEPPELRRMVIDRLRNALSVYAAPGFIERPPKDAALPDRYGSTP